MSPRQVLLAAFSVSLSVLVVLTSLPLATEGQDGVRPLHEVQCFECDSAVTEGCGEKFTLTKENTEHVCEAEGCVTITYKKDHHDYLRHLEIVRIVRNCSEAHIDDPKCTTEEPAQGEEVKTCVCGANFCNAGESGAGQQLAIPALVAVLAIFAALAGV